MKSHAFSIEGEPLRVQVHSKREADIERRAREVLLGREVRGVFLAGDQLEIHLDDGGVFTMSCSGGFVETN